MGLAFGVLVPDDNSYRQALERRDAIRSQLQELQSELQVIEEFVSLYERLFPTQVPVTQSAPPPQESTRKRERNPISPKRLARMAREIVIEAGRPLSRSEITREIEARGIPLVGSDKIKNVGTILWRSDLFNNVEGEGYWPKDVPRREK